MIKIALFPLSNLLDGSKHLWAKIQGIAAHDAAATGNPVRIGGVYHSADPTGTDGDILDLRTNAKGELLTQLSGSISGAPTAVTVGATTCQALAANANRKYAMFINDSDTVIYLMVGASAVANQGIRLNAFGGSYEMCAANGNLDLRVVNAISLAASKNLLVVEG